MRISDWSSDVCSSDLAALEQWFRIVQYLRVEAVGHRVAEVRPLRSAFLVGRIDLGEQRVEVEIVEMFGAAADLAEQFGAADHLVEAAAAELRSEEHTSELQSLMRISYAVFCLKKKKK